MIRTPEAKQLCTENEFQLFERSLSRNIKRLGRASTNDCRGHPS